MFMKEFQVLEMRLPTSLNAVLTSFKAFSTLGCSLWNHSLVEFLILVAVILVLFQNCWNTVFTLFLTSFNCDFHLLIVVLKLSSVCNRFLMYYKNSYKITYFIVMRANCRANGGQICKPFVNTFIRAKLEIISLFYIKHNLLKLTSDTWERLV